MAERWGALRFAPVRELVERRRSRGSTSTVVQILPGSSEFGLDPRSLIQFVLTSRVDLMSERRYAAWDGWVVVEEPSRLRREELAAGIGWTPKKLSQLLGPTSTFAGDKEKRGYRALKAIGDRVQSSWAAVNSSPRVEALSEVSRLAGDLEMFAIRERGATAAAVRDLGGVSAFWQELLGSGETLGAPTAPSSQFFSGLLEHPPRNAAEALAAGDALLSHLASARDRADAERLIREHPLAVATATHALMSVATTPPSRGSLSAIHLLAQLGSLPLQTTDSGTKTVADVVVDYVQRSPVGFRAVQVLTRVTTLSIRRYGLLPSWWSNNGQDERRIVWDALNEVAAVRDRDPYPARSLWVEALRALRLSKDPRYSEPALYLLEERARTSGRPTRERAYAAYCVYLAVRDTDTARVQRLLDELRAGDDSGESRIPPDDGLVYAADVMNMLMSAEVADLSLETLLLNPADLGPVDIPVEDLPTPSRFANHYAVQAVDAVLYPAPDAASGDGFDVVLNRLPDTIRPATQSLIRYALLSIDGSARRRAAEALREAGVANEAGCAFIQVLKDDAAPRWLKEHAGFLLGYLTDPVGIDPLRDEARHNKHRSVRHAAIWALGDIGRPDAEILQDLVDVASNRREEPRLLGAAAYALGVLHPEPTEALAGKVRAALEHLGENRDELVRDLARWGLDERSRETKRAEVAAETAVWSIPPLSRGAPADDATARPA